MYYTQPPSVYTVIENFYNNPKDIVALAKEFPVVGCGPQKTIQLDQLDFNLNQQLLTVFLQLYGGPKPNKNYRLISFFSKHDHDQRGLLNQGYWRTAGHNPDTCRYDDSAQSLVFSGLVMLTEKTVGSDFQIGKVKPGINWTRQEFIDQTCNYYSIPKEKYLAGEISYEEFVESYYKHEQNYVDVLTVKNEFNKLVVWRGDVIHRELRDEPLLTQHIFLAET
jgi:hypothetical protein